jgi:hypothetical protein
VAAAAMKMAVDEATDSNQAASSSSAGDLVSPRRVIGRAKAKGIRQKAPSTRTETTSDEELSNDSPISGVGGAGATGSETFSSSSSSSFLRPSTEATLSAALARFGCGDAQHHMKSPVVW